MSKAKIILETHGENSNLEIGTVALKTTINGIDVILPTISPQKTELFRAQKRDMEINSPLTTFIQHISQLDDFLENYEIYQSDYEEFAKTHPDKLVNYSFDLHPQKKITKAVVKVLRKIQLNAAASFLFEYENDLHQSVPSLKKQLEDAKEWLKKQISTKILVPVIDMNIRDENLLRDKLEFLSKEYSRINLIYRSPNQRQSNWANLKSFLKYNKIWCHMDCVLNRYNNERIAHRVRMYSMGILSTSVGYPFGGSKSPKKNKILKFNSNSHKYEIIDPPHLPSFAEKQDRTWITSLNKEIDELQKMREHVIAKTLYTNYLPTKGSNYLAFTEGI
jgi:hypothetical protein